MDGWIDQAVYSTILPSTVKIRSLHQAVYITIYRSVLHETYNVEPLILIIHLQAFPNAYPQIPQHLAFN